MEVRHIAELHPKELNRSYFCKTRHSDLREKADFYEIFPNSNLWLIIFYFPPCITFINLSETFSLSLYRQKNFISSSEYSNTYGSRGWLRFSRLCQSLSLRIRRFCCSVLSKRENGENGERRRNPLENNKKSSTECARCCRDEKKTKLKRRTKRKRPSTFSMGNLHATPIVCRG